MNTPADNRRRLNQMRMQESGGSGQKRGDDPEKKKRRARGNPTFGRKDGYDKKEEG